MIQGRIVRHLCPTIILVNMLKYYLLHCYSEGLRTRGAGEEGVVSAQIKSHSLSFHNCVPVDLLRNTVHEPRADTRPVPFFKKVGLYTPNYSWYKLCRIQMLMLAQVFI